MEELKTGMKYRSEMTVTDDTTAVRYDSGALPVFSTPAMLALMEGASWHMVKNATGQDTVGTLVNIEHLKACKVGTKVWADAELTAIDGRKLSFNVTAYDDKGVIGKGYHERFIVDPARFMGKL
ncbi:MAG: thioesterase family protein [Bacteroidetes bacterium]|uniref:Thioesterase family protein n=1 Tax=Candidatus Merdivivens pullicola TaxID=2840872 RepID=A0A9D9IH73_9BACT|nr:thioesterase family protein [Candidatus Merdivivens pullicola]